MLRTWLLILLLTGGAELWAQTSDSATVPSPPTDTPVVRRPRPRPSRPVVRPRVLDTVTNAADSALLVRDTFLVPSRRDTMLVASAPVWRQPQVRFTQHPYYRFDNPVKNPVSIRQWQGKEAIFYSLIALLIFFAIIRNGFGRYIQDLFKSFFRTSIRQRQIKEQLLQSPLPSLLLNAFFVLSTGMFAALVLQHFGLGLQFNFWLLYLYCVLALLAVYLVKFVLLKLMGWMLSAGDATDTYIFVIFSTNKIMGMALLPVLLVLGFNQGLVSQLAITLGLFVVGALFVYRFFLSYVSIHRQVQVGFFHFLVYLAAFEIVPLLVINKLLFHFLS